MPAERTQQRELNSEGDIKTASGKSATNASSKKAPLPWERVDKDAEKALRKLTLQAKKEWEANLVAWPQNLGFRFAIGTRVMYKSDAMKAYSLNEKEILSLQHESIPRSTKTLFSVNDVRELALCKFEADVLEYNPIYANPKFNPMFVGGGFNLFEKVDNNNSGRKKNFKDITHRHDLEYIRLLSGKAD